MIIKGISFSGIAVSLLCIVLLLCIANTWIIYFLVATVFTNRWIYIIDAPCFNVSRAWYIVVSQ